jgi:hypothetical protein
MANAKRASMREGPLAALFRKTEGEDGESVVHGRRPRFARGPCRPESSRRPRCSPSSPA